MNIYSQQMMFLNNQVRAKKSNLKDTPANPEGTATTTAPIPGEEKPANALELQGRYNMAFNGKLNEEPANGTEQPVPQEGQAPTTEPKAQYKNNMSFNGKLNEEPANGAEQPVPQEGQAPTAEPKAQYRNEVSFGNNRVPVSASERIAEGTHTAKNIFKSLAVGAFGYAMTGGLYGCTKEDYDRQVTPPMVINATNNVSLTLNFTFNLTVNTTNNININITQESSAADIIAALYDIIDPTVLKEILEYMKKHDIDMEELLNESKLLRQMFIYFLQQWNSSNQAEREKLGEIYNLLLNYLPTLNAIAQGVSDGNANDTYYYNLIINTIQNLDANTQNKLDAILAAVRRGLANVNRNIKENTQAIGDAAEQNNLNQQAILTAIENLRSDVDSCRNEFKKYAKYMGKTLGEIKAIDTAAYETIVAYCYCITGYAPQILERYDSLNNKVDTAVTLLKLMTNLIKENPQNIIYNTEFNTIVIEYENCTCGQDTTQSHEDILEKLRDLLQKEGINPNDYLAQINILTEKFAADKPLLATVLNKDLSNDQKFLKKYGSDPKMMEIWGQNKMEEAANVRKMNPRTAISDKFSYTV